MSGPIRRIMPSALSLEKCFSTALGEMPNFSAIADALNELFSASSEMIFSLPFVTFLPTFFKIEQKSASMEDLE